MRKKIQIKYDLSKLKQTCSVCQRKFRNDKCLADHIFNAKWKRIEDKNHKALICKIRTSFYEELQKKANHNCPACNKIILRNLATHFKYFKDKNHVKVLKKQEDLIVRLLKKGKTISDIKRNKSVFMNPKWILRILHSHLGKEIAQKIIQNNFKKKQKQIWASKSERERNEVMAKVRKAEWGHLTKEQRKDHPWVKAGRKASLNSSKCGSKNQRLVFKLISKKLNYLKWIYNHTLDENWQIDIASPENNIYIEWDGRHHRIPIHGQKSLNNRQNRDKLKNKIITKKLRGTLIRVEDNGRFNSQFVDDITDEIVDLIEIKQLKNKVYYF